MPNRDQMLSQTVIPRRSFVCAGAAAATAMFAPNVVGARPEQETVSTAALRSDFAALYEGLRETHFNLFVRVSQRRYDRLYGQMRDQINTPMTLLEAQRLFHRFVAAGRVAHARIDYLLSAYRSFRGAGGKAFAVNVRVRDGRIFVVEDLSGARLATGEEIVRFDGLSQSALLSRLWSHVAADTPYMAQSLIELDFAPLLWTAFGPREHFELSIRGADGARRRVVSPARDRHEMAKAPKAEALSIDPLERHATMLERDLAYLRPGIFMNLDDGADPYDTRAFYAFIDKSFVTFKQAGARALILDLRDNPGGHNAFSDHMIAWFATKPFRFYSRFAMRASTQAVTANIARLAPGQPGREIAQMLADAYARARHPGDIVDLDASPTPPRASDPFTAPVYVLINRRAYSNSVAVAAIIQDYGFGRILGEETSDLATTLGAMEHFTLPNTGIVVGYPKAYIVRPNGDLIPRGVVPDTRIETPIIESADDPVLRKACALIADA